MKRGFIALLIALLLLLLCGCVRVTLPGAADSPQTTAAPRPTIEAPAIETPEIEVPAPEPSAPSIAGLMPALPGTPAPEPAPEPTPATSGIEAELSLETLPAMELATGRMQGVETSYPADFELDKTSSLFMVFKDGGSNNVNINASPMPAEADAAFFGQLIDSVRAELGTVGAEVMRTEVTTFDGRSALYVEQQMAYTDETIDMMIANGSIGEINDETREKLKSLPPVLQMGLYTQKGETMFVITGTYQEGSREEILNAMKVMARDAKLAD